MKQKAFTMLMFVAVIFFIPQYLHGTDVLRQEGIASWYGREFDGLLTASGEIYDSSQLTAAHPTLPFGTMLIVTNRHNDKQVTVRVNDRGPFVAARIIDVSRAAAERLDMIVTGTAPVLIESIQNIAVSPPVTAPVHSPEPAADPPVYTPPATRTVSSTNNVTPPVSTGAALETLHTQQRPAATQAPVQIRLIPNIVIAHNKTYRLQVGSFTVARNAVETFDRLKNADLNPAYERFVDNNIEHFRVVLPGVPGTEVYTVTEKLRLAGFREAIIREEN